MTGLLRLAIVANGSLAACHLAAWLMLAASGAFWQADYSAYYAGWRAVARGHAEQLYDLDAQAVAQRAAMDGRSFRDGVLPFNYPPWFALLGAPLGVPPRASSFFLWSAVQFGALAWLTRWLWKRHRPGGRHQAAFAATAALAFGPVLASLQLGSFALVVAACTAAATSAWQRHPLAVGPWLTLASVKPQMVVGPGLHLLMSRNGRAILAAAGAFGLLAVLTGVALGWRRFPEFLELLRFTTNQFGKYGIDPLRMYNLKGVLAGVFGTDQPGPINLAALVAWIISAIVIVWLWRWPLAVDSPAWSRGLALSLGLGLFFSPHLNGPDLCGLIVAASLAAESARGADDRRGLRRLAVLVGLAPWLYWLDLTVTEDLGLPLRPFVVAFAAWLIVVVGLRSTAATLRPQG